MLLAVEFFEVVLALHILAVVFAFGATFAYPVLLGTVAKADTARPARAVPGAPCDQPARDHARGRGDPGLRHLPRLHLHLWSAFFVQWGLGVVIVIGAVEGAYLGPREKRLIEVADRDVAAAGDGPVTFGAEYDALVRRDRRRRGADGPARA